MADKTLSRRGFIKTAGAGVASLLLAGCVQTVGQPNELRSNKKILNFVFICADDLGWADLACYGNDFHETPNLNKLAGEGMKFTNAYAAAAICSPTRAAIMSGKYPARLHMTIWSEFARWKWKGNRKLMPIITEPFLVHEQVTLAEVFKKEGYFTAHIGKWHLGDADHYPETQGFDINIGGTRYGCPASFFYPYRGFLKGDNTHRYVPALEPGKEGDYLTDRLTDKALEILNNVKGRPFFLNLWYYTVHTPIEGKREMVEHYNKKTRPRMRHKNPEYAAMVSSLDENVGRVLRRIKKLGLAENTVVIFYSDNGGAIYKDKGLQITNNYPLACGKGALYEGGIRVPLIIRWPGVTKAGSVCDEPVTSMDFYPTFLEMTGFKGISEHNKDLDGVSIAPVLQNPKNRLKREYLYWHYPHYYPPKSKGCFPSSAVRSGDWKLIENLETNKVELYNLREDIGEKSDLAQKYPERSRQLRNRLHAWRKEVNAQMPKFNPDYKPAKGK
jgi:arylsulfatase A-like enzyme